MRQTIQETITAMSEKVGNEKFAFIALAKRLNTHMSLTVAAKEELEATLIEADQFDVAMSFTYEFFIRMAQEGFEYKKIKKAVEDTTIGVLSDAYKDDKESSAYLREEQLINPLLLVALFINIYITEKGK